MFTNSIRWRLQVWLAFLLVCVLSGFGVTVYQLQRVQQFKQIDDGLERRVAALSTALRGGPPPEFRPGRPPFRGGPGRPGFEGEPQRGPPIGMRPDFPPPDFRRGVRRWPRELRIPPDVAGLFDETQTNSFYFAVWAWDGAVIKTSTNAPPEIAVPERQGRDTLTHVRMRGTLREAFHFTELGDCVLAGRSIATDLTTMRHFAWWLLVAGGGVLALGLGGGWSLAHRAIRPIEDISATASRISGGNLSERISIADTENELGRLATVLNSTFSRLENAFAQQKQFTSDASHELRTPLAVLISEAQTALARERSSAEYRETIEACLETAQQMRNLTQSLLELARFDADQEILRREPLDLMERTRACIDLVRPLANERGLCIRSDLEKAPASGDPERIDQVITNLLSNAIHYNKDQGEIRVSTRSENGKAVLIISDSGIGISPEDLPHIFDRFYRADKARSRASGRTGLGLAIAKGIVEAHGGTIEVASELGKFSTFTVRLQQPSDINP